MAYSLKLHRDVEKQLQRIPEKQRERLVATMRSLRDSPMPQGTIKLMDHLYRIRKGEYRVVYAVFDKEAVIIVCRVARRTEATYRDLPRLLARAEQLLGPVQ